MPQVTISDSEHKDLLKAKAQLEALIAVSGGAPAEPDQALIDAQSKVTELQNANATLEAAVQSRDERIANLDRNREDRETIIAKLRESELKLNALEAAGVDNWQGYGEAMALLKEANDEVKTKAA